MNNQFAELSCYPISRTFGKDISKFDWLIQVSKKSRIGTQKKMTYFVGRTLWVKSHFVVVSPQSPMMEFKAECVAKTDEALKERYSCSLCECDYKCVKWVPRVS